MKKIITKKKIALGLIMVMLICIIILTGCNNASNKSDNKLSIVCTIFPQYDWIKNIIGDNENYELILLIDSGVDLHNYQPTTKDLVKIADCDMFIYGGGESDDWVEDALNNVTNKNMQVISMMQILGDNVKEEEIVEGMQVEEHGAEDSSEESEHDEDHEDTEYDEHIWLSIKNAKIICNEIATKLSELDDNNSGLFADNCKKYVNKLDLLDNEYQSMIDSADKKTVLFGDRFPFRYFAEDYNIDYYAAFVGCSAETEASFETITFLAGKIDELGLSSILVLEGSDMAIANTIIDNTTSKNQKILTVNSIQSVTEKDIEEGANYLGIMRDNLEVFTKAMK